MRVIVFCFLLIFMVMQIQIRNLIDHEILKTWILVHFGSLLRVRLRRAWFHEISALATQILELLDSFVLDSKIFGIDCLLGCWAGSLQWWSWRSLVLLQPQIQQFRSSYRCLGLESRQALSTFGSYQRQLFLALASINGTFSWILVIIRFCENLLTVGFGLLSMQHLLMCFYFFCCIFIVHFHFWHLFPIYTLLACWTWPDITFDSILELFLRYHFRRIIVDRCRKSLSSLFKYFVCELTSIILLFFWSVFEFI